MKKRIALFGLGQVSRSPFVTAKQLTNMFCEVRPAGEKSKLVAYGTPGLDFFVNFGSGPARGGIEFPNTPVAYVVHGSLLWEVNNAGTMTSRGVLTTSAGRVSMAHNGVQVMITDGTDGYIYDTVTTTFSTIGGAFPANPVTCCWLGQRFIANFLGSSRFYWSDIADGTTWNALNFANAETNPDAIQAVYASNGQLLLFGAQSTEFWANSGVADPAFIPLQGNATEWGLAATWSIAKYDNSFCCLMTNRMGEVMVAQMNGYLPKKISTIDLDYIINSYSAVGDGTAYSYMLGGHPMFVISFPTAGYTWLFDGSTGIWSKLESSGDTRHVGEFSFSLVGKTVVADYSTGNLYDLNENALTENGNPLNREIIGETVEDDGQWIDVERLRLDMEVGNGTTSGQGVNPQIALSVSRDNGKTYGPDMWRPMGALGQYGTTVEWRRLGTCRSFTPKIRMTDPVPLVLVSACLNPET